MNEIYRVIVFVTSEGFEAVCIDANGVGYGDTPHEALADLGETLKKLFLVCAEDNLDFSRTATAVENSIYESVSSGEEVEDSQIYAVTHCRQKSGAIAFAE